MDRNRIDYSIPFEFTNVYLAQIPVTGGMKLEEKEVLVRMMWDEIKGIEDFADHHLFPSYQHILKCRIRLANTPNGSYLALIPYQELADSWTAYIDYKHKLTYKSILQ